MLVFPLCSSEKGRIGGVWIDCDLVRLKLTLLWAKQQLGCVFGNLGKFNHGPCKRKVLVSMAGTRSW